MRFGTLDGRLVLVRDGQALDVQRASGGRLDADVPQCSPGEMLVSRVEGMGAIRQRFCAHNSETADA